MEMRCPYLGLQHSKHQTLLLPSTHHRCYAGGRPERVPAAFQAEACLTAAYRHCPRLGIVNNSISTLPSSPLPSGARLSDPEEVSPESSVPGTCSPPLVRVPWVRPRVRHADLQPLPPPQKRIRHPLTLIELVVLGLGGAIVLAFVFLSYALIYRLAVGPGMEAPTVVAGGPAATLVPTFTPTTLPTSTPLAVAALPSPSPAAAPAPSPLPTRPPPAASPPTRLVIPALNIDIPVVPVGVKRVQENGKVRLIWDDVPNAGGFHQTSAYPGQGGNIVINGHRDIKGAVFRHLDQLQPGDEIILYVGDAPYEYYVTETLVVPETFATPEQRAANLRLIGHIPEERLTLVTCTPVALATHRLLVIAKPLAPDMPQAGAEP